MKKKLFASFLLIICFAFGCHCLNLNNETYLGVAENIETDVKSFDSECDVSNNEINLVLNKRFYSKNEIIEMRYEISDVQEIVDYTYDYDGFQVITFPTLCMDKLVCSIFYDGKSETPFFTVCFQDRTGNEIESSVFGIAIDSGVFLDKNSYSCAKDCYLFDLLKKGKITQVEYQNALSDDFREVGEETISIKKISTRSSLGTSVRGTLTWKDDDGRSHPLQYVKVEAYDNASNLILGTTYTDSNGEYYIIYGTAATKPVGLLIYPVGQSIEVKTGNGGDYVYKSGYKTLAPGNEIEINCELNMKSDIGQAFQISQAAFIAARYVKEMNNGNNIANVVIKYPHNEEKSGCFYRSWESSIYLKKSSYSSWDVVMHEYGHHVQHVFGIENSPGGSHKFSAILAETLGKSAGIRLAWGESYPSVFGGMAQQYFINDLQNIKTVGDAEYTSYNGAHLNYETSKIDNKNPIIKEGESNEATIIGVLWDLYDNSTDEIHDTISMSHQSYWNLITKSKAKTFSEFINYFYENSTGNESDKLAKILNYYGMTGSDLIYDSIVSIPTFNWSAATYDGNYNYGEYALKFYNQEGKQIKAIENIKGTSYKLSQAQWDSIKNNYDIFYVRVAAYQPDNPKTGGYCSESILINTKYKDIFASTYVRYGEYKITDKGDMSNLYDTYYLPSFVGYNISELKERGYKKIKLTINLDVKEIDDGYQYIAFYDGSSSTAKEYGYLKFEHGSGKKDTNYWTHTFEYTIHIEDMDTSTICIRYNASGAFSDDWLCKNLVVNCHITQI